MLSLSDWRCVLGLCKCMYISKHETMLAEKKEKLAQAKQEMTEVPQVYTKIIIESTPRGGSNETNKKRKNGKCS